MMLDLAPGWMMEIDRGPDWLFIRLHGEEPFDCDGVDLAGRLWQVLDQEFTHRLVLELEEVRLLRSHFVGELVRLHKRLQSQGGMLRLSGLSESNYQVLCSSRLADRFPKYQSREDAVMGYRPAKPR
jgi:anti-anti-sigma regulatory factor